jgi:hypothetical protein
MPHAKRAAALGAAAILLCGCSSVVKPQQGRGKVDDPRTYAAANHLKCLQQRGLPVQEVGTTGIQIGPLPSGPTVQFLPSPGAAQAQQIEGAPLGQGAEVIGSSLLFTHQASDGELTLIENCLASGVSG